MKNAKKLFLLGVIPFFILIASLFMFRLLYRYDSIWDICTRRNSRTVR